MGTISGIMHDPEMFPAPDTFQPERFLTSSDPRLQINTFDLPFGFGRRVCVGMHLARNSLFICMTRILWAFSILPALAEDESSIIPDRWAFTDRFNSRPVSFPCRLQVRNAKVRAVVEHEFANAKESLARWK